MNTGKTSLLPTFFKSVNVSQFVRQKKEEIKEMAFELTKEALDEGAMIVNIPRRYHNKRW